MKQDKDTAWYKAYKDLAKTFTEFVISNQTTINQWKGAQNAEDFFGS